MYGFFEKWVIEAFGLEEEQFCLTDERSVYLVDKDAFDFIRECFISIELFLHNASYCVVECKTTIEGMHLILMRYWDDSSLLHSLVDERTKTVTEYMDFENLDCRLDKEVVVGMIKEYIEKQSNTHLVEELVSHDDLFFINPGNEFIKSLMDIDKFRSGHTQISCEKTFLIITKSYSDKFDLIKSLKEMSVEYNKNIIVTDSESYLLDKNTEEIFKHTIIIIGSPNNCRNNFVMSSRVDVSCFGHQTDKMNRLKGLVETNKKIETINANSKLTEYKKNIEIEKIYKSKENTPFFKYDYIFKDTYTNVIWAAKNKCIVYFLFEIYDVSEEFSILCIREMFKRINGDIPYEELYKIDKEYFDKFNNNNIDEYVRLSVKAALTVFDGITTLVEEQRSEFNKFFDLAMEHSKMVQKYQDQLNAFNLEKFETNEKKRALQNFQDTMSINKVSSVFIKDSTVHVYTKNLYVQDERSKKWHDIGTFHITIGLVNPTYNTGNTVRVYNTKYVGNMGMSNGMQAPHVFEDGRICHGNLNAGMIEAYRNRNMFDLVYQIILFLQSANTIDRAGEYVNTWPEVSEEIALGNNEDIICKKKEESEIKFDDMLASAIPIKILTE